MKREKRKSRKQSGRDVRKDQDRIISELSPAHQRRLLNFLSRAASPFDLMHSPARPMSADQMAEMEPSHTAMQVKLMDAKSAQAIFELREREFPLGFTNINQLAK